MKKGLSASEGYSIGLAIKIMANEVDGCSSNNSINKSFDITQFKENIVLVVQELNPHIISLLKENSVVGVITDIDCRSSQSAIEIKTLGIPSVVDLKDITNCVNNGDTVIVDGMEGNVIINPNEDIIKEYKIKKSLYEENTKRLKSPMTLKTRTKKGKRIEVLGNISSLEDIKEVIGNGGEGIGLFKTEFLYINENSIPTEDEQFEVYKEAVTVMKGKPTIIRTIKMVESLKQQFRIQLRALLRASVYGNLKIIYQIAEGISEYLEVKKIIKECMQELIIEGRDFNGSIQTGVTVEVTSVALNAIELAKYVDFFSIGTNDSAPYTLAAEGIVNESETRVLELIKMTIEAAHGEGKNCSLWGGMASDETLIPLFIKNGLDGFSVNSPFILRTKEIIINY